MKRLAALLTITLLAGTLVLAPPAQADHCGPLEEAFGCWHPPTGGTPGSPGGGPSGGGPYGIVHGWANELSQLLLPEGVTQCWAAVSQAGGPYATLAAAVAAAQAAAAANPDQHPCPDLSGLDGVIDGWEHLLGVPTPSVQVQPEQPVTGVALYLEVTSPEERSSPIPMMAGHRLEARPTYDIDWGDGIVDRGVEGPGVSYERRDEGGAITHTYRTAGPTTITVEAVWTGFLVFPDGRTEELGQIGRSTTHDLAVRQVQAVRVR